MKQYYVYQLINHYGTIEYVGETTIPKIRMNKHTKTKPGFGNGKFYGRQDLVMNIVAVFDNRKDARELEGKLKLDYGMEHTERTCGKITGKKHLESGILAKMQRMAAEKNKIPVLQFSNTNQFIKEWESGTSAQSVLKICNSDITKCCKGKRQFAGGYVWKYKQQ
jgi:predicted GIY-YIG superfamily endonuclease